MKGSLYVILILALLFSPHRFISLLIPCSIMRDPRAGHTSGYCPHVASSLTGADGPMAPTTAMAFPRTHVSSHHCSIDLPHNGIMTPGMPTLDQTPAILVLTLHHSVQSLSHHTPRLYFSSRNVGGLSTNPFNTLCKCCKYAVLQIRAKLRITIAFHPSFSPTPM